MTTPESRYRSTSEIVAVAVELLRMNADRLRDCHTDTDGVWQDTEAEKEHADLVRAAADLESAPIASETGLSHSEQLVRTALAAFCDAFNNRGETTSLHEWNKRLQTANNNATEALAGRLPYAEPSGAERKISDQDRRWRFLEHGCQWVSWTPTGGETVSFDPRDVKHLQAMRAKADETAAAHVKLLLDGAEKLKAGLERPQIK